ncbi:hypothetical protein BDZ89DRAFT_1157101 [Hymenopellis radicata]|nr:hypothetical protein BDZ89DRAFT_1157101 [Hymenopellis radicata]
MTRSSLRHRNAALLRIVSSSSGPPGRRDVGIGLLDGSRRLLWNHLVALNDLNMFDLDWNISGRLRRAFTVTARLDCSTALAAAASYALDDLNIFDLDRNLGRSSGRYYDDFLRPLSTFLQDFPLPSIGLTLTTSRLVDDFSLLPRRSFVDIDALGLNVADRVSQDGLAMLSALSIDLLLVSLDISLSFNVDATTTKGTVDEGLRQRCHQLVDYSSTVFISLDFDDDYRRFRGLRLEQASIVSSSGSKPLQPLLLIRVCKDLRTYLAEMNAKHVLLARILFLATRILNTSHRNSGKGADVCEIEMCYGRRGLTRRRTP